MEEINNSKYDLTDEEYNKCLLMAELSIFLNYKPAKQPTSIFIAAQAGAGKTGLKSYVINEAKDNRQLENYVEFNPDEIAIFHSNYRKILEEFPDESYSILQRFVRPALDEYLRKRAVELETDIVQEGTLANTQGYLEILEFQKNGGIACTGEILESGKRKEKKVKGNYRIEIDALAVDRFESLLSSYEREQYFRENGLPPRVVTPRNHDYSYDKMLETLSIIENKKLFDKIRVFKRGYSIDKPELVYVSGDNRYVDSVVAIRTERQKNRRELLSNPHKYLTRIEELRKRVQTEEQMDRLDLLKSEFEAEVAKQKSMDE